MESLRTKQGRSVVPKKKKTKKKMYFGMEVQDAIVRYNALDADKDQDERNKIYGQEIHAAFDKLSENIINTFKFEYFDDVYLDVKHEVVAFMVMNMHKYDHSKGSKAFSYFSVVAKNYLILHNNANYKKYKMHTGIDILNSKSTSSGRDNYYNELTEEIIKYFENNINSLFKTDKDISIAYAIVELMKTRDGIENFNKKSLYVLIREMTNVETSYITKVVNVFKREYKKVLIEFEKVGYISNKKNKFF